MDTEHNDIILGRIEQLTSSGIDKMIESINDKLNSIISQNSEIKITLAETNKDVNQMKEDIERIVDKVDKHDGLINKGLGAIAVIGTAAAYGLYITKEFMVALVTGKVKIS